MKRLRLGKRVPQVAFILVLLYAIGRAGAHSPALIGGL